MPPTHTGHTNTQNTKNTQNMHTERDALSKAAYRTSIETLPLLTFCTSWLPLTLFGVRLSNLVALRSTWWTRTRLAGSESEPHPRRFRFRGGRRARCGRSSKVVNKASLPNLPIALSFRALSWFKAPATHK